MSSNPKIVVVKMREIIYTLILLFLVTLLIVCLILMFSSKSGSGKDGQVGQSAAWSTDQQNGQTQADQAQSGQTNQAQSAQTSQTQAGQSQTVQTGQAQATQTGQTQTAQTSQAQSGQASQSQATPSAQSTAASSSAAAASYTAGVYTTPITLGDSTVDVEVTLDSNRINAIRLVNLSESVSAAYPLISPSLDHIASQILSAQSLEGITCPSENKYTSQLLLNAISDAVARARLQ